MEQQFQLKGEDKGLSIFEQAQMTGEERAWWLVRMNREYEERRKQSESHAHGLPSMPASLPRV